MTTKKIKIVRKEPVGSAEVAVLKNRPNMEDIFKFYNVDSNQDRDVVGFLESNTNLLPVLIEAKSHLLRIFGQVPFYLELDQDPEEGFRELFLIIKLDKKPEDAVFLENKLSKEWFLPYHSDLIGRFNFGVELN